MSLSSDLHMYAVSTHTHIHVHMHADAQNIKQFFKRSSQVRRDDLISKELASCVYQLSSIPDFKNVLQISGMVLHACEPSPGVGESVVSQEFAHQPVELYLVSSR